MFYFEQAMHGGKWGSCTSATRPETAMICGHLRLKLNEGLGPRVRAVREVPKILRTLTLDQMRECFSPDCQTPAREGVTL